MFLQRKKKLLVSCILNLTDVFAVHVGNLGPDIDEQRLKEAFSRSGKVM